MEYLRTKIVRRSKRCQRMNSESNMSMSLYNLLKTGVSLQQIGYFLIFGLQCLVCSLLYLYYAFLDDGCPLVNLIPQLLDLGLEHFLFLGEDSCRSLSLESECVVVVLHFWHFCVQFVDGGCILRIPLLLFGQEWGDQFVVGAQFRQFLLHLNVSGC